MDARQNIKTTDKITSKNKHREPLTRKIKFNWIEAIVGMKRKGIPQV